MVSLGHIYLVDDDHEIRLHLGNLLRQLNYGVSSFSSADEFFAHSNQGIALGFVARHAHAIDKRTGITSTIESTRLD